MVLTHLYLQYNYVILQLYAIHPVPMEEHVCLRMNVLVPQNGLDLPVDKVTVFVVCSDELRNSYRSLGVRYNVYTARVLSHRYGNPSFEMHHGYDPPYQTVCEGKRELTCTVSNSRCQ